MAYHTAPDSSLFRYGLKIVYCSFAFLLGPLLLVEPVAWAYARTLRLSAQANADLNPVSQVRSACSRTALLTISLAVSTSPSSEGAAVRKMYERNAFSGQAQSRGLEEAKRLQDEVRKLYSEGQYDKAILLTRRILAIAEKALGPEHPQVATLLNNLADLYLHRGDYAQAEPLHQRTLKILEKALGPEHPNVATSLFNIALLFQGRGDLWQAIAFLTRSNNLGERNLSRNLLVGSERQKLAYLSTFLVETNYTLALHTQSAPSDLQARDLAFTTLIQRKGRALDSMTDAIAPLRRHASAQDRALIDQPSNTRTQLATLMLRGPGTADPAVYRVQLAQLKQLFEKLEGELSSHSREFQAQSQPLTLAKVQATIPAAAALVEYSLHYLPNAKTGKWDLPRYAAYVLASQGEPRWVDLGEAAPIDRTVAALRQALRDPNRGDVKGLARALDEQVMRPVRALLGDTRRVLIAPDGALNLIPFGALVDEQNRFLIETYNLSYLTSGRGLLRLQVHIPSKQGPLIVADPQFDQEGSVITSSQTANERGGQSESGRRSSDFTQTKFSPLPGTAAEAKALSTLLLGVKVLTGTQATEAALKQVSGPSILHVATHGFFPANQKVEVEGRPGLAMESFGNLQQPKGGLPENPLLRSGLALAGANLLQGGSGEDGILTALEAAGLDLWGTKLVVLSACETGWETSKPGKESMDCGGPWSWQEPRAR